MSTKIEWTEETWNPVVGCAKVSDGCKHCYAITMANRLAHIPAMADLYMDTVTVGANGKPNWTGVVKVSENAMDKPLRVKKPTMFFVNSMSDLFHEGFMLEGFPDVTHELLLSWEGKGGFKVKKFDHGDPYYQFTR